MLYYLQQKNGEPRAYWDRYVWQNSVVLETVERKPLILRILDALADANENCLELFAAWANDHPDTEDLALMRFAADYRREEVIGPCAQIERASPASARLAPRA